MSKNPASPRFRGGFIAIALLFTLVLQSAAAMARQTVTPDAGASLDAIKNTMEQARQNMEREIEHHIQSTDKQLDIMRASIEKLVDAKMGAYDIMKTILIATAAVVIAGLVYAYKTNNQLNLLRNEMATNMERVVALHKDMKTIREDIAGVCRLLLERNSAIMILLREHRKNLDEPGHEINQSLLDELLRQVYMLDALYSGRAPYVIQAVQQIQACDTGSPIHIVCMAMKPPLEAIYKEMNPELLKAIDGLTFNTLQMPA